MKQLIKIIKGSLVGMGSILPGISGSMVAAILKIYQNLIDALNDFLKKPIQSILSVWEYIVGVILGFIIGFVFIDLFYDIAPIPITFLFIGFILGAIPSLIKEIKLKSYKWHHYFTFFIAILVMIGFIFIKESENNPDSLFYYISVFLVGVIYAVALIIPGLSGSTMLMAFGYFQLLINLVDDIAKAFVTLNFTEIASQLPMLILLILGALIGLILVGKLMHYLLHHFKTHFYLAVLGIVMISPFNILFTLQENTSDNVFQASFWIYLLGAALFIIGIMITFSLSNKKEEPKGEIIYD
jgi:putative membrane protein